MMQMFDKQLTVRMREANVRRWVDDLMPLLGDDPLGVHDLVTRTVRLDDAPSAHAGFQKKQDGVVKVVFRP
jgi:threonine dehydrogenase-like Zn-dependent dehydrogenase